jgi:hypothetical protein
MNTFEITVQHQAAGGSPVVVEQTASGVFLRVRTEGLLQAELRELKRRRKRALRPALAPGRPGPDAGYEQSWAAPEPPTLFDLAED